MNQAGKPPDTFLEGIGIMKKLPFILLILTLSAVSNFALADYFQYTDENGTVVMVDDEGKIPKKYRKKTRTNRIDPDSGRGTHKTAVSGKVRVNNEGKQYAQTAEDCDYANFSKLDSELRNIGFMAGAGGGYVKTGNVFICSPCVKRLNSNTPLNGNVTDVYESGQSIIYKYANGFSYEYCTIISR
jgi:hypothetical protein